ncbi:MAG TPA: Hpt domain-containing protein [Caulobacteraceae bacterium]|jgi:HPt (histidine-containing phosphotransfer) domain-containing protein|nr:Hpt domain-containing protein [Caulobacteraceae bacterium]
MSEDRVADARQKLANLRERFLVRTAGDLKEIETALANPNTMDRMKLRATAHRLAGAAGTFGFPELSEAAGAADDALMGLGGEVDPTLDRLYKELRKTLKRR